MTGSDLFLIWFIVGIVLMLLEFVIPGGIVFFLGLGATLVAVLLKMGLINGLVESITIWFIGSLALLFGLRGIVQKFVPAVVDKSNTDEDIDAYNQIAKVCETIPANGEGRIMFHGSTWPAKNVHADHELQIGAEVRIVFRDNLIWMIEETQVEHEVKK